ncbi:MAG: PadR family transcriptional regulator [Proteobacteria bacterium]|nr:PadR family transcriptional regulator [Pseudomonadota bacterium]
MPTPKPPKLTPTSYALLGLLARKSQTAYELNAQMQYSSIRVYWPRVESHVYTEPKKLLRHELVIQRQEKLNGRNRTLYTITAKGREALKQWLRSDDEVELRMQAEFMLKLVLADGGTMADARQTLEKSLLCTQNDLKLAIAGIQAILSNGKIEQDGAPYNGIIINLMADILIARYRWGKYALKTTQDVDNQMSAEEKTKLAKSAYADALAKMEEALQ